MKYFKYIAFFLGSTFWVSMSFPIFPAGFILAAERLRKSSLPKIEVFPIIVIGAILGFFGNGVYLKIDDGKIHFGVDLNLSSILASDLNLNVWGAAKEIEGWGNPASDDAFLNKNFEISSIFIHGDTLKYPRDVRLEPNGMARSEMEILFEENQFSSTIFCSQLDGEDNIVDYESLTTTAKSIRINNVYKTTHDNFVFKKMNRLHCSAKIDSGKYSLYTNKSKLRIYINNDKDYYIEVNL